MKKQSNWLCLITDPPYSHPLLYENIQIIEKLLNFGDNVILFLYMDGVHNANDNQNPMNMENIGKYLVRLKKDYSNFKIQACSRCSAARGYLNIEKSNPDIGLYVPMKLISNVQIVSVLQFGKYLQNGYQLIQIRG